MLSLQTLPVETMPAKPLNHNQIRFVEFVCSTIKEDPTAAYLAVYKTTNKRAASAAASRLMCDPRIKAAIQVHRDMVSKALEMTQQDVLEELRQLATADPRELIEYRRGCCRYCYGEGNLYQRTPRELRDSFINFNNDKKKMPGAMFDMKGGVGFNPKKPPVEDCPECFGEGVGYEFIKDTRTLSPSAAKLYAGVKITKDGIEIKTRSQDKAVEMMGRAVGVFKDKDADDGSVTIHGGLPDA